MKERKNPMQDLMENFKKNPVLIQTNFPADNLVTMPEYKKYLPIKLNETWKPEVQQELERKKNFYTSESLLEIRNKHPLHRRLTAAEHSGKNNLADGLTEKLDKEKEIKRLVKRLNQLEAEAKEIRVKLKIIEYESKNAKTRYSISKLWLKKYFPFIRFSFVVRQSVVSL